MTQHFLLSAAAKTLSLSAVARMSDDEARATFQRIRWADNGGEAYCPQCGVVKVYKLKTRPVWRCSGCCYQFSVTAGTIFADRKPPVRDYLLAIAIFVNGAKGHSALQLSRDLACQYKTAFVRAGKHGKGLFRTFFGISPFRYRDIFQKGKRKRKDGTARRWYAEEDVARPMLEQSTPTYFPEAEIAATSHLVGNVLPQEAPSEP